jgi:hypothetical protein
LINTNNLNNALNNTNNSIMSKKETNNCCINKGKISYIQKLNDFINNKLKYIKPFIYL